MFKALRNTPFAIDLESLEEKPAALFMARVFALPVELKKKMTDPAGDDFIFSQLVSSYKINETQAVEITRTVRDILLGDLAYHNLTNKLIGLFGNTSDLINSLGSKLDRFFLTPVLGELKKLPINHPHPETPPPLNNPNNTIDLRGRQ